jgi:hypothetical protein
MHCSSVRTKPPAKQAIHTGTPQIFVFSFLNASPMKHCLFEKHTQRSPNGADDGGKQDPAEDDAEVEVLHGGESRRSRRWRPPWRPTPSQAAVAVLRRGRPPTTCAARCTRMCQWTRAASRAPSLGQRWRSMKDLQIEEGDDIAVSLAGGRGTAAWHRHDEEDEWRRFCAFSRWADGDEGVFVRGPHGGERALCTSGRGSLEIVYDVIMVRETFSVVLSICSRLPAVLNTMFSVLCYRNFHDTFSVDITMVGSQENEGIIKIRLWYYH